MSIIAEYNMDSKKVNALEIGSWEGLSSYFILSTIPNSHLTCVDTWEGADEHKDSQGISFEELGRIEENFDKNLTVFAERLKNIKEHRLAFTTVIRFIIFMTLYMLMVLTIVTM